MKTVGEPCARLPTTFRTNKATTNRGNANFRMRNSKITRAKTLQIFRRSRKNCARKFCAEADYEATQLSSTNHTQLMLERLRESFFERPRRESQFARRFFVRSKICRSREDAQRLRRHRRGQGNYIFEN